MNRLAPPALSLLLLLMSGLTLNAQDAPKKKIPDVPLKPCCKEVLQDIEQKFKARNYLQKLLVLNEVLSPFTELPSGTECRGVHQVFLNTMVVKDMPDTAKAILHDIPKIAKESSCRAAELHLFSHMENQKQEDRSVIRFWENVVSTLKCDE